MEIIGYTYSIPLFSGVAGGRIKFVDENGKIRSRQYEVNKKMGRYMVLNCGSLEQPQLKVIHYFKEAK